VVSINERVDDEGEVADATTPLSTEGTLADNWTVKFETMTVLEAKETWLSGKSEITYSASYHNANNTLTALEQKCLIEKWTRDEIPMCKINWQGVRKNNGASLTEKNVNKAFSTAFDRDVNRVLSLLVYECDPLAPNKFKLAYDNTTKLNYNSVEDYEIYGLWYISLNGLQNTDSFIQNVTNRIEYRFESSCFADNCGDGAYQSCLSRATPDTRSLTMGDNGKWQGASNSGISFLLSLTQ
jgi:hypothetical protein